jgi:hypothetical protein
MKNRTFTLLVGTGFAYGFAHAIPLVRARKTVYKYDFKDGKMVREPLLWIDQVGIAAAIAFSTPVTWPLMLREDLVRLECLVRGKRAQDYLDNGGDGHPDD